MDEPRLLCERRFAGTYVWNYAAHVGNGYFQPSHRRDRQPGLHGKYELPSIISDIAGFLPDEMWSRERHAVNAARVVNKVTYKTPDGMLCSAQDYYPGHARP